METIRVGVIGVGRGDSFMHETIQHIGFKLVAVCDKWQKGLDDLQAKHPDIATYQLFEDFLRHDGMDAVVLANYFHEHAAFAIAAMEAGYHVLSETTPAVTMAECVALVRAAEKTDKTYMLAENYPFTRFNQEMTRRYRAGDIGEVIYAEGEYNHPASAEMLNWYAPEPSHWRTRMPCTYYSTHALAPLMYATRLMPVSVSAQALTAGRDEVFHNTYYQQDPGSVILCRMANGAVFRLFGVSMPGHSIYYRYHGTRGAMESERGATEYWGTQRVRVWREEHMLAPGQPREEVYYPEFDEFGKYAKKTGHGGGDFYVMKEFADCLRAGKAPLMDVYASAAMSAVAILGWRSALAGGKPFTIPDFRDEAARAAYADDHRGPFAADDVNQEPVSLLPPRAPSLEEEAYAKTFWIQKE